MNTNDIFKFLMENRDVLVAFVISLVAVVKLTAWGKAQATALDTVVGIIEQLGARGVKFGVANSMCGLSESAQDAIADSVAKVDPKKKRPSLLIRILRGIFRL